MKLTVSEFFKLQEEGKELYIPPTGYRCKSIDGMYCVEMSEETGWQSYYNETYPVWTKTITESNWEIENKILKPQLPEKIDIRYLTSMEARLAMKYNELIDYLKAREQA